MSWLTPVGFLGFIGLLILFIIYIIKPNYQNKFISSTYIWKLSLKFKKKRVPRSKLRNLLLLLCQILVICACTAILAQPFIDGEDRDAAKEKILIIDGSGSMLSSVNGETRFERAIAQATELADQTVDDGGVVSVILADREANFVAQRLDDQTWKQMKSDVEALVSEEGLKCSYGDADIDGAMLLAEAVLAENPRAEVLLYTGTSYIDAGSVTVVDVSDQGERNVAILDVRAVMDENYYRVELDMASYGNNYSGSVCVEIKGAYGSYGDGGSLESFNGSTLRFEYGVDLIDGEIKSYRFGHNEDDDINNLNIYSYSSIYCYVQVDDSLSIDNTYYLYGGSAQPLKIQYYSMMSNTFVGGMLLNLRDSLRNDWDIEIKEIQDSWDYVGTAMSKEKEIELEGYDIYIFEHHIPKQLPTDGLVILLNPDEIPKTLEFNLGQVLSFSGGGKTLSAGENHPIMSYIDPQNIEVSRYTGISSYDSGFTPIMYVDNTPVALVKNEPSDKMLVVTFNFHYSNFPVLPEYPLFMYNVMNYFMPTTFEQNVYELYDTVTLNSRSEKLTVSGPAFNETLEFESFPAEIHVDAPGTYTVTQIPISGIQVVENFSVTIPAEQSNITRSVDTLTNPYCPSIIEDVNLDLVFYFAIALVTLLFCEWWLKSRDN